MTHYSFGFHVISLQRISEELLNRLHSSGYDWQRSSRHVGQDGVYHYHYIFFSDSSVDTLSFFRTFFYGDFNVVFFDTVRNVNPVINYVLHS